MGSALSRNYFPSINRRTDSESMRKLNHLKIRWIIREMKRGELSVYRIAKQQRISTRWARELHRKYMETGEYPYPRGPGRPAKEISEAERKLILELRQEHPLCAMTLERILHERGKRIPHNRIHRVLRNAGIAKQEPRKSRRRKWIRYQRRHSNSLWHTDWFKPDRKHLVILEDDASRFITGFSLFDREASKNAAYAFSNAVDCYGKPKQILSDNGTSFKSIVREGCQHPAPNLFQRTVDDIGSEHINTRVSHPQCNGKVERVYQTLVPLKAHFGSWEAAVDYYNNRRPHMSLSNDFLRTPSQAFTDKQRRNRRR